jgi:spore germination protein KB
VNDYRLFVYPVGLVIAVMSMWVAPNMQELANFLSTNGTFYILSGYLVFPFLVLAVAWLRRRASARRA